MLNRNFCAKTQNLLRLFFVITLFAGQSAFTKAPEPTTDADLLYEICMKREHISGYALNFLGSKYRRAGNSPRTGFDCSGFTSYIMREFDIKISPCSATQSTEGKKIALKDAQAGDLLFFGRRGHIQHVALILENTEAGFICVHSTSSRGVIVENVSQSDYWASRLMFARDVIEPAMLAGKGDWAASKN